MLDEWDSRRGRSGRPWERVKKEVYARLYCAQCGNPVRYDVPPRHPLAPSVDHIVPLSKGGHPTALANCQLMHLSCNSSKGAGTRSATRPRSRDY